MKNPKIKVPENPTFEHDCDRCCFLGHWEDHDLYYCPNPDETVVARFSSDGPDYSSGMVFANGANPHLSMARRRAQEIGLIETPRDDNGNTLVSARTNLRNPNQRLHEDITHWQPFPLPPQEQA